MNIHNNLILVKGEDKTEQIASCNYENGKYQITFKNSDKVFSYAYFNVDWYTKPECVNPNSIQIMRNGNVLNNLNEILVFKNYYRVFYNSGKSQVYNIKDIIIENNALNNKVSISVFMYFKQLSGIISLKTDDGVKILSKKYDAIDFVDTSTVLADYINPPKVNTVISNSNFPICYPFGCNLSQMSAVNNAFKNKISVIEGPPGTGKTQTILNIIANAIIRNKTVAVVSNNNSATDNVFEKLQKFGFDFFAAQLGSTKNKQNFISNGQTTYPDFNDYMFNTNQIQNIMNSVVDLEYELKDMLTNSNNIAELKNQLAALKTEKKYFDDYYNGQMKN